MLSGPEAVLPAAARVDEWLRLGGHIVVIAETAATLDENGQRALVPLAPVDASKVAELCDLPGEPGEVASDPVTQG